MKPRIIPFEADLDKEVTQRFYVYGFCLVDSVEFKLPVKKGFRITLIINGVVPVFDGQASALIDKKISFTFHKENSAMPNGLILHKYDQLIIQITNQTAKKRNIVVQVKTIII